MSCNPGFFCARGTSKALREKQKCGLAHFCPLGTSSSGSYQNHCPFQTHSVLRSSHLKSCEIKAVSVCDKVYSYNYDPLVDVSYYPEHRYRSLTDELKWIEFRSAETETQPLELMVVKKIIPINSSINSQIWKNDTIEVYRACPSYGSLIENDSITVIGRYFQNRTTLTCRFTFCNASNNNATFILETCINGNSGFTTNDTVHAVKVKGQFISMTRVQCPFPKYQYHEGHKENEKEFKCRVDEKGVTYYLQTCRENELLFGACSNAYDVREAGYKRFYSLSIPCSDEEIFSNACENQPDIGMKINPCLSKQVLLDVSNNGVKFSGDRMHITHGVGEDYDFKGSSTFVTFTYIMSNIVEKESITHHHKIDSIADLEKLQCNTVMYSEEYERPGDDGWIELRFMNKAHLQFDWRHIPLDMKYDEHFRLAIYAKPSRCKDLRCSRNSHSIFAEEVNPCTQPMKLPGWFSTPNTSKHQIFNLTLISLDDSIFKVEIHILHGLFISSSEFFLNTLVIDTVSPSRAKTNIFNNQIPLPQTETRMVSPFISWEEKEVDMEYFFAIRYTTGNSKEISLPLNMPPRWNSYARGRILLNMNVSNEYLSPSYKDVSKMNYSSDDFWMNPFITPELAKEKTDAYFETFHGINIKDDGKYEYKHSEIITPYLPFFSNCREFDSYIFFWELTEGSKCSLPAVSNRFRADWWRREFPPLPHMDDLQSVGPFDFQRFYPIADWCEQKIYCNFEEDLNQPDITPRWFETNSGVSLFSIIREPVNYFQYTGRDQTRVGFNDGGGQKFTTSSISSDTFIPVKIDRSVAEEVDGECNRLCYPREMILDIAYYQVDRNSKRIVSCTLALNKFDKNASNSAYELDVRFRPLDYRQLIIQFAYSRDIFVLLFVVIGIGTSTMALLYWIVVRFTTQLENPPSIRFFGLFWLIVPQALTGFVLGIIPVVLVTTFAVILLKGPIILTPYTEPDGLLRPIFQTFTLHYKDDRINPENLATTRQGRMGLAFVGIAVMCIIEGSKIFIPNCVSKTKKKIGKMRISNAENQKAWKRSNFLYVSFIMGLFLVMIVEWSFWDGFGTYIWEAIIALKIMNILASNIVDNQLEETLLSAPVITSMGLIQGLVTLSAVDFMDFLLSYIVEFGFLVVERMYTDPFQSMFFDWIKKKSKLIFRCFRNKFELNFGFAKKHEEANNDITNEANFLDNGGETVEPIIESYGSYCCDTASLFYTPIIIILLMVFRDELGISKIYGIKEQDMEYYLTFAIVIIPFQIIADIFIHSSQELFHGWKIYDYLVYSRYRFLQRETKWKGLEDSLDECIDESMRTMDQMCFSNQFYMMLIIHVNGIVYFVLGIEMMVRANYNLFGDPATPILLPFIIISSLITKKIMCFIGSWLNIWQIRHENTAWHIALKNGFEVENESLSSVHGASHEAFVINQRITSETFRYKFLNYNRSWLIDQLPKILTPRTLRRSNPYLINQFSKIMRSLNDDISEDSELEGEVKYNIPSLNTSSRKQLRLWLNQAKRRIKLKEIVQPMIQNARGSHCEICLSLKQLHVQTQFTLEEM